MAVHEITKGLDLPIAGAPTQVIREDRPVTRVALMGDDFTGMKPSMRVQEGDTVRRGQPLFEDRKTPGVLFTAPGAGRVIGIHRGARRVLQSVVIDLSDSERADAPRDDEITAFDHYRGSNLDALERDDVVSLLVESGMWVALRTRPFSKVPAIDSVPHSLFVTAIDTHPMAPLPDVVVEPRRDDFERGLRVLSKLVDNEPFLCLDEHSQIADGLDAPVRIEHFSGPHPAGTVGLHIHMLDPVGRNKTVWHIGYQDVIAVGTLFATGRLDVSRTVSIAGPPIDDPILVRTRLGASTEDLVGNTAGEDEVRLISGSVLSGKKAQGDAFGYLGRYDRQVSVVREGRKRILLGWLTPGLEAFSILPIYLSRIIAGKRFDFSTTTNGSPRAMVPIGSYERVMPMDILPTFLLRALVVGDVEQAEKLGCLELDEEDLALCTFVDPGKSEFGLMLRKNLEIIEKEG